MKVLTDFLMHKLNQKTTRLQRFFGARSFDLFPDIFASLKCARKGIFLPKNPVSNHTRWEFSFSSPLHEIQKTLAVFLGFLGWQLEEELSFSRRSKLSERPLNLQSRPQKNQTNEKAESCLESNANPQNQGENPEK
jgi:hypothetical protein